MRKYFGTDGIRGKVGEYPITPDFALRLGYAAGKVLAKHSSSPSVIIGKDTRLSGYLFESAIEAGLSFAGVDVYMAGPIPTPAVAYLTRALRLDAGIVISASHNPYEDNGIKFFAGNGSKLDDLLELEIESMLDQNMKMAKYLGKVKRIDDASGRYIEFCKSTFANEMDLKGLKIVIDCANGATYKVAPQVFHELGAEVIKIACEPNGININENCGSTNPQSLIKAVCENKADFGIAFDGDGDRLLIVDSYGVGYDGDKLIYIILQAYLAMQKPIYGLVGTVMTNLAMEHALQKKNIELVRARVGDRYVLEELNKRNWSIGGEASGHILCLDKHSTGDGIVSALQVLQAVLYLKKPMNKIVDWQEYPQTMINIKLLDKNYQWQDKLKPYLVDAENELGNNGRIVVRASGTEPLLRIMVEASNIETSSRVAQALSEVIIESML